MAPRHRAPPASALDALCDAEATVSEHVAGVRRDGARRFECSCCGECFWSHAPQDPVMEPGYGHCTACHSKLAVTHVVHGWPHDYGDPRNVRTFGEALARLQQYA